MAIIVETKSSKITRTITRSIPIPKKRKPIIVLCGQGSNYQKSMKRGISVFEERIAYSTDGSNKVYKTRNRVSGDILPKPCWKSFDKRRNQWKKEGYPSVRILNETDKCVFPSVIV